MLSHIDLGSQNALVTFCIDDPLPDDKFNSDILLCKPLPEM